MGLSCRLSYSCLFLHDLSWSSPSTGLYWYEYASPVQCRLYEVLTEYLFSFTRLEHIMNVCQGRMIICGKNQQAKSFLVLSNDNKRVQTPFQLFNGISFNGISCFETLFVCSSKCHRCVLWFLNSMFSYCRLTHTSFGS